jgi:hypothetical protein
LSSKKNHLLTHGSQQEINGASGGGAGERDEDTVEEEIDEEIDEEVDEEEADAGGHVGSEEELRIKKVYTTPVKSRGANQEDMFFNLGMISP